MGDQSLQTPDTGLARTTAVWIPLHGTSDDSSVGPFLKRFPTPDDVLGTLEIVRPDRQDASGWFYRLPGTDYAVLRTSSRDVLPRADLHKLAKRSHCLPSIIAVTRRSLDVLTIVELPSSAASLTALERACLERFPSFWIEIATQIRRLHEAGWGFVPMPPFSAYVDMSGERPRLLVTDLARLRRLFPWQLRASADAWGSFLAGLPDSILSPDERKTLIQQAGRPQRLHRRGIRVAERAWRDQGLVPKVVPTRVIPGRGTDWVEVQEALSPCVVKNRRPTRFEEWFGSPKLEELRRLSDRLNARVTLDLPGGEVTAYLKSHAHDEGQARQGPYEWSRHLELRSCGIPTPLPLATGVLGHGSFFLSRALPEGRAMDRLLEDTGLLKPSLRNDLLQELASLVARLHRHGFSHSDLYLCHVYWTPRGLVLMDLQRTEGHLHLPEPRRIKDLAALDYSSRTTVVTDRERRRFFIAYLRECGLSRDRRQRRSWAKRVVRRSTRLKNRHGPYVIGGDPV